MLHPCSDNYMDAPEFALVPGCIVQRVAFRWQRTRVNISQDLMALRHSMTFMKGINASLLQSLHNVLHLPTLLRSVQ